jgi:hypothetical protein
VELANADQMDRSLPNAGVQHPGRQQSNGVQPTHGGCGEHDHGEHRQVLQAIGMCVLYALDQCCVVGWFSTPWPVIDGCTGDELQSPIKKNGRNEEQCPRGKPEQRL